MCIFQSTLPREERPQHYLIFKPYARISIHAPTRGATNASISQCCNVVISIHAPTRGATGIRDRADTVPDEISIHAPTRGATTSPSHRAALRPDFNPRSHERSDNINFHFVYVIYISIHAPTRGATKQKAHCHGAALFQSTLPREERRSFRLNYFRQRYFNPRSHERSDLCAGLSLYLCTRISIHAPTRGATVTRCELLQIYYISIHAPTRGATVVTDILSSCSRFQSTLPREERPLCQAVLLHHCLFQSTLPREERHSVATSLHVFCRFQSTLPREERRTLWET